MVISHKRHAHELVLEKFKDLVEGWEVGNSMSRLSPEQRETFEIYNMILSFLEDMIIPPEHQRKVADEIESFLLHSALPLHDDEIERIENLIKELRS